MTHRKRGTALGIRIVQLSRNPLRVSERSYIRCPPTAHSFRTVPYSCCASFFKINGIVIYSTPFRSAWAQYWSSFLPYWTTLNSGGPVTNLGRIGEFLTPIEKPSSLYSCRLIVRVLGISLERQSICATINPCRGSPLVQVPTNVLEVPLLSFIRVRNWGFR